MLINIHSAKCIGIEAVAVTVEIDIAPGLGIHLVGLADAAVKESLLRTITALQSMGFRIPGKKIVINLAPADMHKKGSGYDVPIALGIIAASGQRDLPLLEKFMIMGELGLDGSIREVPGSLPIVELARKQELLGCILPQESALEAVEYEGINVYGVRTLDDVLRILCGEEICEDLLVRNIMPLTEVAGSQGMTAEIMDFSEIMGQDAAKRGLEIAAAGGHNVIMIGPPGSGKSSLAKAMAGILPPMSLEESVQTSKIYSVAGKGGRSGGLMRARPFRAPHYSASVAALLGGGSDNIMPGEISLAHNGVLFIDEFCEAPKKVLEVLRGRWRTVKSPFQDSSPRWSILQTSCWWRRQIHVHAGIMEMETDAHAHRGRGFPISPNCRARSWTGSTYSSWFREWMHACLSTGSPDSPVRRLPSVSFGRDRCSATGLPPAERTSSAMQP